jgi:hypothetical protein
MKEQEKRKEGRKEGRRETTGDRLGEEGGVLGIIADWLTGQKSAIPPTPLSPSPPVNLVVRKIIRRSGPLF